MSKYPAYVEGDSLFLITADGQLLSVNIISGQIYPRNNAYDILSSKLNWTPTVFKRKIKKVKYPEDFVLPKLKTGKTIGEGLAQLLKRRIASDDKDSATIQIYVYSLLINRQGKCGYISVSPSTRSDITNYYGWKDNYEENKKLEDEIEKWIAEQTLKTNTIPKTFSKFEYHGFVYLKD